MVTPSDSPSPTCPSRRDTAVFRPIHPSPPAGPVESNPLSTSEPTLRFPRPQGNHRLATWISSSDPDIMHLNTLSTEDTGISESTYELVASTDSESQDGNYTESISESVGSLDYHRPDDVVSLAGSEHTFDDESVVDISVIGPAARHTVVDNGEADSDLDDNSDQVSEDEADSDDSSRESLHRFIDAPKKKAGSFLAVPRWLACLVGDDDGSPNYLAQAAMAAVPGLLVAFVITVLSPLLYPSTDTTMSTVVSTVAPPLTHTSSLSSALAAKTAPASTSAPTTGVGLIPLPNPGQDEWLFSSKPTVSFAPHGKHDVLIHVRQDVKAAWMSKDCLTVTVMRKEQKIDVTMSPVEDGILVQFPRWDAYGTVNLSVQATCRPKTQKEVKVHFGKGIIVEAFERTKNLAHDLSDLVPAAAHEAERRLSDMKQSLQTRSDSIWQSVTSSSETASRLLAASGLDLSQLWSVPASDVWFLATKTSHNIAEEVKKASHSSKMLRMQTQLKIGLLDAQISARRWWLKVSGPEEAYAEYTRKAQEFLRTKREAAAALLTGSPKASENGCKGYRCASKRRARA